MKILQLANKNPFPPKDGGELAIKVMADGLAEQVEEFVLLMMTMSKHPKSEKDYQAQPYRIENVPVEVPINVYGLLKNWLFSSLPYPIERFIKKEYASRLKALLTETDFDIVQIESLYLAPYISLIRTVAPKTKIVLRAHNAEYRIWQRNAVIEHRILKKIYLKFLAKRMKRYETKIVKQVDVVVPISSVDSMLLSQLTTDDLSSIVIPFGIDVSSYLLDNHFVNGGLSDFAYLGALDWYPNQEGLKWFLEKVWKPFNIEYPQVKFHIAGRRAPRDLEKYFETINGVVYHGEIGDAMAYLKTYPVFITPLFSGSGMRVKLIEQMAAKRLVVTTSVALEGIEATHGKEVLVADEAEKMIMLLKALVENIEKYNLVTDNAYEFVKQYYDNKVLIQKLIAYYKNFVN